MGTLTSTRSGRWSLTAAVVTLVSVLVATAATTPGPVVYSTALLVVAGAGLAAAVRQHGLDRIGWGFMALATLVGGMSGVVLHDHYHAIPMAVAGTVTIFFVALGLLCFLARTVSEAISAGLQAAVLTAVGVMVLWVLGEPTSLRWTPGYVRDKVLVTDLSIVLSYMGVALGVVATVTRRGRARWICAALTLGLAFGAAADTALWSVRPTSSARVTALVLRSPEFAAFVGASVAAALAPPDPHRTPLLERSRDLTITSVLTLVGVLVVLPARTIGADGNFSRMLTALVVLLVATHLYEAARARTLTASIEAQGRHMRLLVSESRDIIIELDPRGRVVFASEALRNILGRRLGDFAGKHVSSVIPELTDETLRHVVHEPRARMQPTMRVESVLSTPAGTLVHAESVVTPLERGYLVAVRDVTERVGLQSRLQQVTYQDPATGLPNRSSLDREIRNRLYSAGDGDIALVLLDMFSSDAQQPFGDDAGDEALRVVGAYLPTLLHRGDMVARLGDHRYAVLLAAGTTSSRAVAEAERLVDSLTAAEPLEGLDLRTVAGVCIGERSATEILRNADLALHRARLSGSGSVVLFEPGMLAQHARTRDLRRLLARDPDAQHWTVLYQPVVNLQTGRTEGVEALLRWTDPEGDFIGIEEVIRLAEEFGSIIQIGAWVLDQAVAQAARWAAAGRPLRVAVNASVHQLTHGGFAAVVEETLARHGVDAGLLTIEITETVLLEQTAETTATFAELRALGVKIAIDDFGTGYSGLANIRSLPLDILKIDRTFIQGLGAGGSDEAVVNAVTSLGHELGLAITAEGIETPEQERLARSLGIAMAQGYLFARPLPAAEVTALVARETAEAAAAL